MTFRVAVLEKTLLNAHTGDFSGITDRIALLSFRTWTAIRALAETTCTFSHFGVRYATVSTRTQTRERIDGFHMGMRLARRHIRKWTQSELAFMTTEVAKRRTGDENAGVSVAMICMIESQKRTPSLEVASWIAEALGFDVADLWVLRPDEDEQVAS